MCLCVCVCMYVWAREIYKLDLFCQTHKIELISQQWHPFENLYLVQTNPAAFILP